jgi:hypothetical protein
MIRTERSIMMMFECSRAGENTFFSSFRSTYGFVMKVSHMNACVAPDCTPSTVSEDPIFDGLQLAYSSSLRRRHVPALRPAKSLFTTKERSPASTFQPFCLRSVNRDCKHTSKRSTEEGPRVAMNSRGERKCIRQLIQSSLGEIRCHTD